MVYALYVYLMGTESMIKIKIRKRKLFRMMIDISDTINFWFQDKFNLNPKRAVLEKKQDIVTLAELDNTIGKSLGIK